MDYIFIDMTDKKSIYKQIAESIEKAIHLGNLKYGNQLPTEKQLREAFNISSTAVRQAYNILIEKNLISRTKGKGTFVTNRPVIQTDLFKILNFDYSPKGPYYQKILSIDKIRDDYLIYDSLGLAQGDICYVVFRVIFENGNPVMAQKIYLPHAVYPHFQSEGIHLKSLPEILNIPSLASHTFDNVYSVINAPEWIAILLKIEKESPVYFIQTTVRNGDAVNQAMVLNYLPGQFIEMESASYYE